MIGIYKITNMITNDFYIGLSNDIERRWQEHKTPKNIKNKNTVLARAFRKYGIENFRFEVIEECTLEELASREQHYIKIMKPRYNMTEGGKGNLGRKLSREQKERLRKLAKEQWNRMSEEEKKKRIQHNLKGPRKGHPVSEETRRKLRAANIGKKQSEETIQKRREKLKSKLKGNKNGNKKVAKIDPATGETLGVYESVKIAGELHGINPSNISSVLIGRQKSAAGFYWVCL